jgi:hypothetical protein
LHSERQIYESHLGEGHCNWLEEGLKLASVHILGSVDRCLVTWWLKT